MKNIRYYVPLMLLATLFMMSNANAIAETRPAQKDSLTISIKAKGENNTTRQMMQSAYPVKLTVKGNNLRIHTERTQMLPIYRQNGSLYLSVKLTPGTNWLGGLPRGNYFINNRTIRIS